MQSQIGFWVQRRERRKTHATTIGTLCSSLKPGTTCPYLRFPGLKTSNTYHNISRQTRSAMRLWFKPPMHGNERGGANLTPPHLFDCPIWDWVESSPHISALTLSTRKVVNEHSSATCGRTSRIAAKNHRLKPYGEGGEKMKEGLIVVSVYAVGLASAVCVSESAETTTR